MAVCSYCRREMTSKVGCTLRVETVAGQRMARIPFGKEPGDGPGTVAWLTKLGLPLPTHCHDCGCPVGKLHHPGCDKEMCPNCHGQAISCGCYDDLDPAWETQGVVPPMHS